MDTKWRLEPGDRVDRSELQKEYGGRTQAAIGPSKRTPNVLLFADPFDDEERGVFSGWRADDLFHFPGEGLVGDQRLVSGNQAIADHRREGRALRLFLGRRGEVEYVGEFEFSDSSSPPWYWYDAPESGDGPLRQIVMFCLAPKDAPAGGGRIGKLEDLLLRAPEARQAADVPIEVRFSEEGLFYPNREPDAIEVRKRQLIQDYARHLRREGRSVTRKMIVSVHGGPPKFTHLFDDSTATLIEATGSVSRPAVQLALGRILDLRRNPVELPIENVALLLPSSPNMDFRLLLQEQGIELLYPHEGTKQRAKPGQVEFVSVRPDPQIAAWDKDLVR